MYNIIPKVNKCLGMSDKDKPCNFKAMPGYHYCGKHCEDDELKLCNEHMKRIEYGNLCKECHIHMCHKNFNIMSKCLVSELSYHCKNNLNIKIVRLPQLIEEAQLPESYISKRMWEIDLYIVKFSPEPKRSYKRKLVNLSNDKVDEDPQPL